MFLHLAVNSCSLPPVANGYIVAPSKFLPGDHARLFCDNGFFLLPRGAKPLIRCNTDGSIGSFDEAPLSCEGIWNLKMCIASFGLSSKVMDMVS